MLEMMSSLDTNLVVAVLQYWAAHKVNKSCCVYLIGKNNCLSRCSTARGSNTASCLVGPTKVKACKSVLFTKSSLVV